MTTFKFCELVSKVTIKKVTSENEQLLARIMKNING